MKPLRRPVALAAATLLGGLGLAEHAVAQPASSEHIELVYDAPAGCPADDAFRAEVRGRVTSESDWEARPGELARRIAVSVVSRDGRYVAGIDFLNPQGERITRSVAGTVCSDVVNGIALVTALAIQSRVEEALAESEPVGPVAEPKPSPEPDPPKTAPPAPLVPVVAERAPPKPRTASEPSAPRRIHVRLGGSAVASTGVGPEPALGPAVFAAVEWDGPRVGVTATGLWSGRVVASDVAMRFRRLAARLEGCPGAWGVGHVAFEPCGAFELGSLRGDADDPHLVAPTGGGALWLAPGVIARLVTSFEPLVIVLEGNAGVPLVRQRFGVLVSELPSSRFRAPAVVLGGALGLGVRL